MVAFLTFTAAPTLACGSLWVSIQGGEARLAGVFKQFYPATVLVPCGKSADIVIAENSGKLMRRSGAIQAAFDGTALFLQVGLEPYQIPIPPNGVPVQVRLDDYQSFRGGVVLTAIQDVTSRYQPE